MPDTISTMKNTKVGMAEHIPVLSELTHTLEGKVNEKGIFTLNKVTRDCDKC